MSVIRDLASAEHWTSRYSIFSNQVVTNWIPNDYDSRSIWFALRKSLDGFSPKNILEVGCGNSKWLPFLSKFFDARVEGVDYSEFGCEGARAQLAINDIDGKIYCCDIFEFVENCKERYDFIFSLGFVEHFDKPEEVLKKLSSLLKPGGILFTEVPNLSSFHGHLSKIYQPKVLEKHNIFQLDDLISFYKQADLQINAYGYAGYFSLNIVAWGIEPRWQWVDFVLLKKIRKLVSFTDRLMCKVGREDRGGRVFSPFIYVSGYFQKD